MLPPDIQKWTISRTQDRGESPHGFAAGPICSQRTTSDEVSESGVLHTVRVSGTHTFMSSKTQYTNTRRNARVSVPFCVSRDLKDPL